MAKKDFIICYDISNKRRLEKISKIINAEALRIQRSVYFYEKVTKKELNILLDKVLKILDKKSDDLRIYTIKDKGIHLGEAINLNNPYILL